MSKLYYPATTTPDQAVAQGLPKGLAKLLTDPRVTEIEDDRGDDNGYWIYIANTHWSPYMECRTIHEDTVKDCLRVFAEIEPSPASLADW